MRKFTFLSVLLLLTCWVNTSAETLVNNVNQLTDGAIVALQCRDTNGGANYYFNGKTTKSPKLQYSNLYKVRALENEGEFALQSMLDGTYIGKDGNNQAIKATKTDAAPFTATIVAATGWTTVVEGTENGTYTVRFTTDNTFLNAQAVAATPVYATGTGGYSVWYVYTFTQEEAEAMQPWHRFASPRGGYLNANGTDGNLQHIDNNGETSLWKIVLNDNGDGVKLYNASQTLPLASQNGFTEEGATWYILDNPYNGGYKCITQDHTLATNVCIDANNNNTGTGYYRPYSNDYEGTSWAMSTYSPTTDLAAAIEALEASLGTDPGYILSNDDIATKIATAKAVVTNEKATLDEISNQQAIIEGISAGTRIMPETGKFYMIINSFPSFENQQQVKKAMYSDATNVKWGNLNVDDRSQYWTIVPVEGGYAIQNYGDHKYMTIEATTQTNNAPFLMGNEALAIELAYLAPGQFNIKANNNPAHTQGHSNGAGVGGNIISWSGAANTASSWYIHEVEELQAEIFENATINYTVNGVVKKTVVANFDTAGDPVAPVDFITLGTPAIDRENNTVTIPCTYNLPFTASESFANANWQMVDMHCNDTGMPDVLNGSNRYMWTFVAADEDVQLPKVAAEDVDGGYAADNRKWAFVGNPFDGFKIYNKEAGETLTLRKAENGNTPAVMSATDDRNVFFLHKTTESIENSFAWKLADDTYYVNTQAVNGVKVLRGWTAADGGSSCRVFGILSAVPTKAFYRIKGVANELYLTTGNAGSRMPMIEDGTTAASIFYFGNDRKLLNYGNGLYTFKTSETGAVGNANTWEIKEAGNDQFIFYASAIAEGGGRYLYNHNAGDAALANRNSAPAGNNTLWTIEQVNALPVTVSAAGYATLYAPVATEIPEGAKVYTGVINEEKSAIELTEVEGVVPANTAVLVQAEAGTYNFAITEEAAAIEGNDFIGSINTVAAPADVYTLQNQEGNVGFYPYTGTNVNGFKAYLTIAADANVSSLSFNFGDATAIESVFSATEANKSTEMYDLAGRRVTKPVKGLYIVGGKKVIVK